MTTRIFRVWQDRILSATMTKRLCQQYARSVVALDLGMPPAGNRTALVGHEATALRLLMQHQNGVRLTAEHTAQGLTWMRRNPDIFPTACFDRFSHFTYPGDAYDVNRGDGYRPYLVPVWRIHTFDGATLDYAASPWQSGVIGPVILHRSDPLAA